MRILFIEQHKLNGQFDLEPQRPIHLIKEQFQHLVSFKTPILTSKAATAFYFCYSVLTKRARRKAFFFSIFVPF